jgi:hypothetical protein
MNTNEKIIFPIGQLLIHNKGRRNKHKSVNKMKVNKMSGGQTEDMKLVKKLRDIKLVLKKLQDLHVKMEWWLNNATYEYEAMMESVLGKPASFDDVRIYTSVRSLRDVKEELEECISIILDTGEKSNESK